MKIFPYKKDSKGNLYPIIEVYLTSGNKTAKILTLVDSGASTSVFTTEVAKQLNIEVEKGKETYLGGVGGRIKGYIYRLQLKIAEKEITAPVIFSHEYLVIVNAKQNVMVSLTNHDRFRLLWQCHPSSSSG